jgi:enoyl-CoA hydratase/carnithine racemase
MNDHSLKPAATRAESVLLRTDEDAVALLTLNRPRQYNALSSALLEALHRELDALAADDAIRVVMITGAGSAFCSGHDLKEMRALGSAGDVEALFVSCSAVMQKLTQLPQPTIAVVNGLATAAGCQLVAQCDLAVAADRARFAASGVNLGLFCSTPAVPISRNVSRKRAAEMLFTGDFIDAQTALDWGLVNRVAPVDHLDAETSALAQSMIDKPGAVLAAGKKFFYEQLERTLEDAYALATEAITRNMLGDDAQEGVAAFVEKRKPRWNV